MFSPIVLLCALSAPLEPANCFASTPEFFFETNEECNATTLWAIENNLLTVIDISGKIYNAVDYTCVNWKASRA
jgi:hypothetical protein